MPTRIFSSHIPSTKLMGALLLLTLKQTPRRLLLSLVSRGVHIAIITAIVNVGAFRSESFPWFGFGLVALTVYPND